MLGAVNVLRMLTTLQRQVPRVLPLMKDAGVPLWAKVLAIGAAVLIVSPLDILSDIPIVGFFDDAVLLGFVVNAFVRFAESRTLRTN